MNVDDISVRAVLRTDLDLSTDQRVHCLFNTTGSPSATAYELHYPLEMGIVIRGEMRRIDYGGETTLKPGQFWFCGMWEPHGYQVACEPCHRIVLMIDPAALAETSFPELPGRNWMLPFTVRPGDRPPNNPELGPDIMRLAEQFLDARQDANPYRQVRLRLLLWELLLTVTRNWNVGEHTSAAPPDAFNRVKIAIDAVFSTRRRIGTQDAARLCGLSRNRFSAIFQRVTGITFADFDLRYRLSGAARHLISSDEPLNAVAYDWGFSDGSHLCRAFEHHYGLSPSQYRHAARRDGDARPPA
jgi:AraC-like DNA-binding protein